MPGDANLRVVVRPHGLFGVRGISDTMSYVISQAQNPNLTLEASSDPIDLRPAGDAQGRRQRRRAGQKVKPSSARLVGAPAFTPVTEGPR